MAINRVLSGDFDLSFPIGPVDTKMYGPYKQGERLLYEKPWIFVVSEKTREKVCNHCFQRKPDLKRCTGCGFNFYCGRDCQKSNWKFIHKHECPVFKQALADEDTSPPLTVETVRLCLQAVMKIKNDPNWDKPADGFPELPHRTLPNLMSHWEDIKVDPKEFDFIERMSNYFGKLLKGQGDYNNIIEPNELGVIYGKIRINNMTIFGTYGDKLGVGLYLSGSTIDHACLPNACPSFYGTLLNIHATEDVDSFSSVRLSYLDQIYFSGPRREMLKRRYYFDCFCRACVDPTLDRRMNGLKCLSRNCDGPVFVDPYTFESNICLRCGKPAVADQIEDLKGVLEKGREVQLCMSEAKKLEDHQRVMRLAEELHKVLTLVLHSTNSLVISTSLQIACSADILGAYEIAFKHFTRLTEVYPQTFPIWSFQYAEILMKCTTRGLLIKTMPKAQKELLNHFVEAMKIISVCAGRDSPTFAYYKKFYDDCREVCFAQYPP